MNPEFVQKISERPNAFVMGLMAFMPACLAAYMLMSWVVMGEIDFMEGVAYLMLIAFLIYLIIDPPMDILSPIAFGALLLSIAVYPVAEALRNRRLLREITVESVESCYQQLGLNPNDGLKLMRLARAMEELGFLTNAIGLGERAVSLLPDIAITNEKHDLRYWHSELANAKRSGPLKCLNCHNIPAPHLAFCDKCASPFLVDHAGGNSVDRNDVKHYALAFGIGIGLLIAVPALAALGPIPALVGIPVLLVVSALAFMKIRARTQPAQ